MAVWMITNCKNGISSYEISPRYRRHAKNRVVHGPPNPTCHADRIVFKAVERPASRLTKPSSAVLLGTCTAADKARKIHGTGGAGKVAVMGLLERHGEVRTMVVPNTKRKTLEAQVKNHVEDGSIVYSDGLASYDNLAQKYIHSVINHAEKYVDGQIHVNGVENFWSLLKRAIKGTYVSVEPYHLFRYLDEQTFDSIADTETIASAFNCHGENFRQASYLCRTHWQTLRRR